jgi:cytosine/adenosine deaminase-related metal-dependent hydrolase
MPEESPESPQVLLRARIVVPISSPPIKDGAVRIAGNRISEVGRWRDLSSESVDDVVDLGEVLLLPGLVNAHCHLDYTSMAGMFPPPRAFTDWIKSITSTKAEWSYSDFAESWLSGAKMLVRTGTTTVGDIETLPELLPEVWEATPLRVLSFLEMTGVKSRRKPQAVLQEAIDRIDVLSSPRCSAGLSPHAPYSTVPELLRLAAQSASDRGWRVCTHVAESALEFEMFSRGRGEMFDWLRRSQRDMSDCGRGSPVQHMERNGALGPNLLAVHANYLGKGDAALIARRKTSVAHCPQSHDYFQHDPFPLRQLTEARVNICLGTDSLASVYKGRGKTVELNLFDAMRALEASHPWLSSAKIVRMATVNGARALGLQGRVGQVSPNAFADLIAIPFTGKIAQTYDAIVQHKGNVAASMVDGGWAIPPADAMNRSFGNAAGTLVALNQ